MFRGVINRLRSHKFSILSPHFNFASKIIQIKLPDLGEGTKDATVRKWFKNEGESVKEEESLVEVETDKLTTSLPSTSDGILTKINFQVDQQCLVGKVLCEITVEDNNSKAQSSEKAKVETTNDKDQDNLGIKDIMEQQSDQHSDLLHKDNKILCTPAVRYILKSNNIKPSSIIPTGKGGRILKEDVLKYLEDLRNPKLPKHAQTQQHEPPKARNVQQEKLTTTIENNEIEDKTIKITGFQKAMTKTMTQSLKIPSFLFSDEFNVDKLVKIRTELNSASKIKYSYMPFIIKAVSLSIKQYPILNSLVNPEEAEDGYIFEYTQKKSHNISIAMDSAEGLIVPNIKNVESKSVFEIQIELNILKEKVEQKRLSSADLHGGTFTISNIGNIGGKVLNPVILPPQSCIIGLSKILDSVKILNNNDKKNEIDNYVYHLAENKNVSIAFHKAMNICISADHRIIDGATVARFSEVLRNYIENPLKIMIEK